MCNPFEIATKLADRRARCLNQGLFAALACTALAACSNAPGVDSEPQRQALTGANETAEPALADSNARPDPNCSAPGCIRRLHVYGDYTREDIMPYLEPGVTIDNGYTVIVIEYATGTRTSTATVTIPYPLSPPPNGYAVVANAHGTAGLDDPCQLSNTVYGTGLAGLFGAHGAIGVAPDYPGLGTPGLLPYLVAAVEGAAVLDSLRAVEALAPMLGVPLSQRYAAVGLSEGGHAVLAAAALHASYAPELDIRAFAAAGPASVRSEDWQLAAASSGAHIPYQAMLFYAWSDYYHYTGPNIWSDAFASRMDDVMTQRCSFALNANDPTYEDALGTSADEIFAPDFLSAYRSGELTQAASLFAQAFADNRIGPYQQTAPLAIWQGRADSVIPEYTTAQLVDNLRQGGVTVDYHVIEGGDHTTTAFGFLAQNQAATAESIAWVLGQLE
jgi:hypothetical protein